MTLYMNGNRQTVEVLTLSQEHRRRWPAEEKAALVGETYEPGMSVLLVARRHGGSATPQEPVVIDIMQLSGA